MLARDCQYLIAAYDGDKDGKLDYREFERLVMTNDKNLKMKTYGRSEPFIGYRDKLHFDVEFELSKLFKLEIERLRDLNIEMKILKDRNDFSRFDCFKAMDKYKQNNLQKDDIRMFLDRNN